MPWRQSCEWRYCAPMTAIAADLGRLLAADAVLDAAAARPYLSDATETRGLRGRADAVVLPADAEQARVAVAWCYENDVPVVPRGGGSGYAGGAVPDGGVVLSLERLRRQRSIEPLLWRAELEAGVTPAEGRPRAREDGLLLPPDPRAGGQAPLRGQPGTHTRGPP